MEDEETSGRTVELCHFVTVVVVAVLIFVVFLYNDTVGCDPVKEATVGTNGKDVLEIRGLRITSNVTRLTIQKPTTVRKK